MLRAITSQRQSKTPRLWFSDQNHDLFIWLDKLHEPMAFQLSYNKIDDEHCICWHCDKGFSHDRIDSGEDPEGSYKMTPIMVPDGKFDHKKLAQEFQLISADMEPRLANFIYQKLSCYADF